MNVLLAADAAFRPPGGPTEGAAGPGTPMSSLALLGETLGRSWTGVERAGVSRACRKGNVVGTRFLINCTV